MIFVDLISLFIILIATLHWWPSRYWLFEVSGYFSQQIVVLLLLFTILRLVIPIPPSDFSNIILLISLVLAMVHLGKVLPYTFWGKKEVPDANPDDSAYRLTFIVANIYQYNRQYGRFVSLVENTVTDVLVLLETDQDWTDHLVEHLDRKKFPYQVIKPQPDTYGLALFSRFPIMEAKIDQITNVPSVQAVIKETSGQGVSLYIVHPMPPAPGEAKTSLPKKRELLGLSQVVKEADCERVIVTGDLNEVAWSKTSARFLEVSGLRDPRRGRSVLNTFPASFPLLGFPLDHFYCSDHFKILQYRRLKNIGSDHFPLLIEFAY